MGSDGSKKVLIVSDTHGYDDNFFKVLEIEGLQNLDLILHAGDVEGSAERLRHATSIVPIAIVKGNNDFGTELPKELELELGPHRIHLCHGHADLVNINVNFLLEKESAAGADILVFGHTHVPMAGVARGQGYPDGVRYLFNPGSLTYPRQAGRRPSYIMLDMATDGALSYEIRYL